MRKALLFLVPMLFVLKSSLQAQTQFWSDNFEDSGAPSSGTRTPTNNGGNATSYFKRTDGTDITYFFAGTLPPYSSWQGSKFWAGKDYDNPSGLNTTVEQQ
ncbi:MAG TPA: hypothetical protein VFS31_07170, partial [Chitinophagaceae bacterium]|nr:hypothetical protein [Chitinophagaceae bacterium]